MPKRLLNRGNRRQEGKEKEEWGGEGEKRRQLAYINLNHNLESMCLELMCVNVLKGQWNSFFLWSDDIKRKRSSDAGVSKACMQGGRQGAMELMMLASGHTALRQMWVQFAAMALKAYY